MKLWHLSLALTAALLVTVNVRAEDTKPTKADAPVSDTDFLVKAVTCGTAEVKFAEIAERRASNADVKAFANKMATDHKKCNEKLLEQAKNLKVAVVTGLERDRREIATRLGKLEGQDFDRDYMKQMVEDHEKAISLFESYTKTGSNKELVDFAREALPVLREHLKEAKSICEKIKS